MLACFRPKTNQYLTVIWCPTKLAETIAMSFFWMCYPNCTTPLSCQNLATPNTKLINTSSSHGIGNNKPCCTVKCWPVFQPKTNQYLTFMWCPTKLTKTIEISFLVMVSKHTQKTTVHVLSKMHYTIVMSKFVRSKHKKGQCFKLK